MITRLNESKILAKHISCEGKYKCDGGKCNSNQKWNNNKCWYWCRKHHICEKNYIWNPTTCSCENGKYLANIIDDSVITCEEIIEDTKSIPTNFNEKTIICEAKNLYILLTFLLITIALLTAVGISLCIVKYKVKQKHLLPRYITNKKFKEVLEILRTTVNSKKLILKIVHVIISMT